MVRMSVNDPENTNVGENDEGQCSRMGKCKIGCTAKK